MKKIIAALLIITMMASFAVFNTSAATTTTEMPDWVITEIAPDTNGEKNPVGGYANTEEAFLFVEIVNTSGRELNLYEYCLTWYKADREKDNFEGFIDEITPIKGGNFHDQSTCTFDYNDEHTYVGCGCENCPKNPEMCLVAPGEVVVLWFWYDASALTNYNGGKGLSVADFRKFWNVPDDVKVIVVDGMEDTKAGGHEANFIPKKKDLHTFGICEYDAELLKGCNAIGSDWTGFTMNYTEFDLLKCWASLDLVTQITAGHIYDENVTYNFTYDFGGYVPNDTTIASKNGSTSVADGRRMILLEYRNHKSSAGTLTTLQKMTLGMELEKGETLNTADVDYFIYSPTVSGGEFEGYLINDVLYKLASPYEEEGPVFTAKNAGVYTFDFKYTNDGKTYSKVVELGKEDETTAAPDVTTDAPEETTETPENTTDTTEETTNAPEVGGNENTTAEQPDSTTEAPKSQGCGGAVAGGLALVAILGTAIVLKKRD